MADDGAKPAANNGQAGSKKKAKAVEAAPKKEVKIMMLHGYTQSGPSFQKRTRALEKLVVKTLASFNLVPVMVYPTAPNRLRPSEIPGYADTKEDDSAEGASAGAGADPDEELDAWAWWRLESESGTYRRFNEGMLSLATCIRETGGIDGVVGFSQGAAAAALLTAALEQPARPLPEPKDNWAWVEAVRAANNNRGLRFAVIYSGFIPQQDALKWLFEPRIKTPTLHYIGGLDTVVDESRSRALAECTTDPDILVHPGSHFVPSKKEWIMPLIGFIKKHAEDAEDAAGAASAAGGAGATEEAETKP